MLRKPVLYALVSLFLFCGVSFAQDEVDVDITSGGNAKCIFTGKVPFRKIQATNNNLVTNVLDGTVEVSIQSELDTEKSTISADISAIIEALSDPTGVLSGQPIDFQSKSFQFLISKTRKSDGKLIEISNETPEGEQTQATGRITVTGFENNQATGVLRMVFENTLRTIEKLDEDIETDENGRVVVRCSFSDIPVTIQ